MKHVVIEGLGWAGMAVIVLAFALNSFGVIGARSLVYQILNLAGAIGILVEAASRRAMPPAVLNVIWALVALVSILRMTLF